MKPSLVTTTITRNLGVTIGIGLCLGLGLLGLSTYSSSQASSPSEDTVHHLTQTQTSIDSDKEEGRSQHNETRTSPGKTATTPLATKQATKQVSPAAPVISPSVHLPVDASTIAHEAIEQTIADIIPGLATCPHAETSASDVVDGMNEHRYTYHTVDLNGDRQDEFIVQLLGPMTCGTGGCTTLILQESSNPNHTGYDVVTQMSVVNFPVIVSDRTSSGWNDLLVMVSGGGTQPGYRQLKFDGQSYPTNPSLERMVEPSGETSNGKVLTVSEEVRAIAPILAATDCES